MVRQLTASEVHLTDGTIIPYGLCIWSTGVGPTPFTLALPFAKTSVGRLAVDKYMRVLAQPAARPQAPPAAASPPQQQQQQPPGSGNSSGSGASNTGGKVPGILADESDTPATAHLQHVPGVYALGDCCANPDAPLPALAQVAEQQGRYLASVLNQAAAG